MRLILIAVLSIFAESTITFADEVDRYTEYRCDPNSNIFEIRNQKTINGQTTGDPLKKSTRIDAAKNLILKDSIRKNVMNGIVENKEDIEHQLVECALISSKMNISVNRTNYFYYSQHQCGGVGGASYEIEYGDNKLIWPSFHDRCLRHYPLSNPDKQPLAPSYLRISQYGIFICGLGDDCRYMAHAVTVEK